LIAQVVQPIHRGQVVVFDVDTQATDDPERIRRRTRELAADVSARADERDALYKTIGVKVVTPPFDVNTRARSLSGPVANAELVEQVALELLGEFEEATIRKVGVRVSNLEFATAETAIRVGGAALCVLGVAGLVYGIIAEVESS